MTKLENLLAAIEKKYQDNKSLFDGNGCKAFYFHHAPQIDFYPIIVYSLVDSVRDSTQMIKTDYDVNRIQFSIFTDRNGFTDATTLAGLIETLFHQKYLTMSDANTTNVEARKLNEVIIYNDEEKVWQINVDYQFMITSV